MTPVVHSLRTRLLLLLVPPLVLVALFAGMARYHAARVSTEELFDRTLLAVALAISRDVARSGGDVISPATLDLMRSNLGDEVYYHVAGAQGGYVTGYAYPPVQRDANPESDPQPRFFETRQDGRDMRVVVLREYVESEALSGWATVTVWQTMTSRKAMSFHVALWSLAVMGAVIVAAALVLWFGVRRGLRPLTDLENAIAQRSPDDLTPIRRPVPLEVQSLVEAMNGLLTRLDAAFASRDRFISDAAHQLRNPIAGVQSLAEAAERCPIGQEMRSRVADVADAARGAGRLTRQLLSLERVRSRGPVQLREAVDVKTMVAEIAARMAPAAMRRGVAMSFDCSEQSVPVRADPVMLGEAVDNLVDNALRYGCRDGGTVDISVARENGHALVTVVDDGPGVEVALGDRVFSRFVRGAEDTGEGCGLGLAIVREVARQHGGDCYLVQRERGSRFVIRLPCTQA